MKTASITLSKKYGIAKFLRSVDIDNPDIAYLLYCSLRQNNYYDEIIPINEEIYESLEIVMEKYNPSEELINKYIEEEILGVVCDTNTISSEDIIEWPPDKYHPNGYKFNKLTGKIME